MRTHMQRGCHTRMRRFHARKTPHTAIQKISTNCANDCKTASEFDSPDCQISIISWTLVCSSPLHLGLVTVAHMTVTFGALSRIEDFDNGSEQLGNSSRMPNHILPSEGEAKRFCTYESFAALAETDRFQRSAYLTTYCQTQDMRSKMTLLEVF